MTNIIGQDWTNIHQHSQPVAYSPWVLICQPQLLQRPFPKSGLTYSFDYDNARVVLLDQWVDTGDTSRSTIPDHDALDQSKADLIQIASTRICLQPQNILAASQRQFVSEDVITVTTPAMGGESARMN